ncbi:MAG: DUF2974 domain-containing protein [Eubacteriales bacterium]|nr:DUF2974 domain-containing protein [Eubacteriales bacterium]
MGRAHTDAEMLLATQIAYLNVDQYTAGGYNSVGEILDMIEQRYAGQENLAPLQRSQLETVENIRTMMQDNNLDYCSDWRIIQQGNRNTETGFYAVTIDTGYGDAILGFRGSETWEDTRQGILDWGIADVGLLNSYQTQQQRDAERYVREFERLYGDQFTTVSTTGHSLGGNLAEHAAITAPRSFQDKLDRATNWDGPGFSDEYIRFHTANGDIAKASDKIDHYRWSFVSSLLNPVPGTNTICIDSKGEPSSEEERNERMFGLEKWRLFRHSPMNVLFYGGEVREIPYEDADLYFKTFGPISRAAENTPGISNLIHSIPVIGTVIYVAERANHYASVLRVSFSTIQNFAEEFTGYFAEEFKQFASELRRRYMQSKVSGTYSVDTSVVRGCAEEMDRLSSQMREIQEEVRSIAATLPYDSVSGNYYRAKLYAISAAIGSDAQKAGKCATAGRTASGWFESAENRVTGRFS